MGGPANSHECGSAVLLCVDTVQYTFDWHPHVVSEGEKTPVVPLPHLTDEERALFNLLKRNNWRVEQERLDKEWVTGRLKRLLKQTR